MQNNCSQDREENRAALFYTSHSITWCKKQKHSGLLSTCFSRKRVRTTAEKAEGRSGRTTTPCQCAAQTQKDQHRSDDQRRGHHNNHSSCCLLYVEAQGVCGRGLYAHVAVDAQAVQHFWKSQKSDYVCTACTVMPKRVWILMSALNWAWDTESLRCTGTYLPRPFPLP